MKKSVAFQSTYALVKLIFTPSWPYFMSIPVMKFTELSERVRRHFSKYWNLIKQSAVHTHTRVSLLCVRRIYVHICTYVCAHTTGRMTRIWTRPPPDTCHHRLLHYDGPADLPVWVIQSREQGCGHGHGCGCGCVFVEVNNQLNRFHFTNCVEFCGAATTASCNWRRSQRQQ